jgi:hypothetical protein
MYRFGSPWSTNDSIGAGTTTRNGEPERTWQSVQWHTITRDGSTSAVKEIRPQWQAPSMCMIDSIVSMIL